MKPETLLRLYPRPWQERYGDEFLALLREEPPGLRVTVDVIAGAVDAWVSPQRLEARLSAAGGSKGLLEVDERGLAPWRLFPFLIVVFAIPWSLKGLATLALSWLGDVWWIATFTLPAGLIAVAWAGGVFWRLRPYSLITRACAALLVGGPMWLLGVLSQLAR